MATSGFLAVSVVQFIPQTPTMASERFNTLAEAKSRAYLMAADQERRRLPYYTAAIDEATGEALLEVVGNDGELEPGRFARYREAATRNALKDRDLRKSR